MSSTRRDIGRPRGKPIEDAIVAATLDELARHGLEGLSVPRVAEAAGVNKTTVYRRWPTREDLIRAALEAARQETAGAIVDTGTLRGDLLHLVALVAARVDSAEGRALARAAIADAAAVQRPPSELVARDQSAEWALVQRAAARGEWDLARHPPEAVLSMLTGSVLHRVWLEGQPASQPWAEVVVDLIVRGLGASGAPA